MIRKTLLITGGNKGLGKAITEMFSNEGYQVMVAARSKGYLNYANPDLRFIETDVTKPHQLRNAVAETIQWTGKLDVLINNAGMSAWNPLSQIDEDFWNEMINTNLKSVLFASQAAAVTMRVGSVIINISSLAGKRGSVNNAVYCAAKFGVNGITQSLAKELGVNGIRVNAVCPVYIRTNGLEEALNKENSPLKGAEVTRFLSDFARTQTALGVLPTADQVASTCLFLASENAGAITGQCINVDCGVMPQ